MTNTNSIINSRLYKIGIIYTLIFVTMAAVVNYFTWDTVYDSSVVNAFIFALSIVFWIGLYIPVPVFMTKANWRISDFGFVFNNPTVIASLVLGILMTIRLGGTIRFDLLQLTLIEAFARVGEELFFRGFLFTFVIKLLKGKEKSVLWAILISSFLFAIVHTQTFLPSNPLTMLDIFISGLIIVTIRHFTGSILPGIITHLAGNAGVLGMIFGVLIYGLVIIIAHLSSKFGVKSTEPEISDSVEGGTLDDNRN